MAAPPWSPASAGASDLLRRGNEGIPLGRWGRPRDTANLVEWVVGDAGGWVTGQTLVSDGGSSLGWTPA